MMDCIDIQFPESSGCNLQLPDPYLLSWYEQAENRTLWLDKELTEDGVELTKKIIRWNAEDDDKCVQVEDRTPIKVMLSSPGGDLYTMLGIADTILMSKTPIYTCAVSLAASAACVILIVGHKRFAFPHAHGMWHSGSAGLSGSMEQVQSATKHLDGIESQMQELLLSKTKIDAKKLKRMKDKDWYFTAEEMLENGLVDRIVSSVNEII